MSAAFTAAGATKAALMAPTRRLAEVFDADFTAAERGRLAAVLPLLDRLADRL